MNTSALHAGDLASRIANALADVEERRDFALSADLKRAAWIVDDTIEWADRHGDRRRFVPGGQLPPCTHLELVSPVLTGVCRSTDSGVEVLVITGSEESEPTVRTVASFMTPRTCLLPRVEGAVDQILAVNGFDDTAVLYRIGWRNASLVEIGRLPLPVNSGVWLSPDRSLALNLTTEVGRSSVYSIDLDAGQFNLLFEASPESEDRIVLFDEATNLAVFTTDAFAYPAVGVARLGDGAGIRFFPAIKGGDEAGIPCSFVTQDGRIQILLRHEDGIFSRLRLADPESMVVSTPLDIPEGEIGVPVEVKGATVRFPYSTPERPWCTARFDIETGHFTLESDAGTAACDREGEFRTGRATTFAGPAGPMPALIVEPDPDADTGDLAVVALHGGPIDRTGAEWKAEFQLFARLGLPVVALDYPGSTGWGQPYMRALFGAAGQIDVEAVTDVIDELTGLGRRVILYGESYGGFLALQAAAARTCAGVIALAPFASFERLKERGSPEVREVLELLDGGNSDETGRNALKACRIIRSRVLIVHGTADKTIPVDESRALAEALRERRGAGEDAVRIVELESQGHELNGRAALARSYLEIAHFVGGLQ